MVKKLVIKNISHQKEKYMCAKHKKFSDQMIRWKKIIKANNLGNLLNSSDDSMSSADIVDQALLYGQIHRRNEGFKPK